MSGDKPVGALADQYQMRMFDMNGKEIYLLKFRALGWDDALQTMRRMAILNDTSKGPLLEVTLRRLYVTQEGN